MCTFFMSGRHVRWCIHKSDKKKHTRICVSRKKSFKHPLGLITHFLGIMDIKCIFLVIFMLTLWNEVKVNSRLERYTLRLSEEFEDINNVQLFEFVIRNPQIVNKVISWIIMKFIIIINQNVHLWVICINAKATYGSGSTRSTW